MLREITCAALVGALPVCVCAQNARAQLPAPNSDVAHGPLPAATLHLSLEQAVKLARERAPDVRLAQRRVGEAEATRVGAGIIMPVNPRLTVDARSSLPQSAYPTRQLGYGATVDFLFDVGGAPSARVREADNRTRSAQAEAEVVRFYAGLAAWRLYVAAAIAQQRIQDTQEALSVVNRMMDAARERTSAGAAGDIDIETTRLEMAQTEAMLQGAVRERDGHWMGLREVLDLRAAQTLVLTTRIERPPSPPSVDALIDLAMRTRPELQAIRAHMQLLVATDERLEREVFPRIGVFTGVDSAPYSAMFWSVGASIELPVAQRNQGPRAVTAREMDTDRARYELEQRRIAREVIATHSSYEARRGELTLLVDRALPAAERNLALIEIGWRSGRFDVFRVTAASRDLVRAKGLRLDALEAAWMDRIALEQASGGWPP
jgi:outer membrane protein, heavy metal efflux system